VSIECHKNLACDQKLNKERARITPALSVKVSYSIPFSVQI
jgi:hypothetical protein